MIIYIEKRINFKKIFNTPLQQFHLKIFFYIIFWVTLI